MTAPSTKGRRSRDPPSPKPILDRRALVKALDNANISLKAGQLDDFYKLMHRQHYPDLPEFVNSYYRNEQRDENHPPPSSNMPLKNPVSARKRNGGKQLPKKFLDFLKDPSCDFVTCTSKVQTAQTSADGSTTKLAIRLHDGHVVESVIMRYTNAKGSRATLCVSSQVGCAMLCSFCATGTMGFRGNLSSGEILEQVVHAGRILAKDVAACASKQDDNSKHSKKPDLVRNVVFMGMGEPLNNYNNVIEACRGLISSSRWNLAHGRVTVSTVGITPKMRNLTRDLPQVSLALSLHAPNQAMRSAIVPAAKNYPIEGMIDALDEHMMAPYKNKNVDGVVSKADRIQASKRKRAMIEYVMLEGDTSSFECAHQLGKLCENRHLVVNLIPYNQTDVKDKLKCPSEAHMNEFHRIVTSYGAFCTIRRTMGADITGACGQLVAEEEQRNHQSGVNDIEDGPFGHETVGRGLGLDAGRLSNEATRPEASSALVDSKTRENKEEKGETDAAETTEPLMEQWIRPLAVATSLAASCFLLSSILFLSQKQRR